MQVFDNFPSLTVRFQYGRNGSLAFGHAVQVRHIVLECFPFDVKFRVISEDCEGIAGVYLLPICAVACVGLLLSTVFRNSAAAIVGTLMFSLLIQLIGILPGLEAIRPYLLSAQFDAWQGFLRSPVDWDPVLRAVWVCALYAIPALVAAGLVFLRRDVAGD